MSVPSTNNRTQSGGKRGGRKWMPGSQVRAIPRDANVRWSLDIIGIPFQRFRILTVADDFTRECLGLVVDKSFTALRVARELGHIIEIRGRPRMIVSDCGFEFTSIEMSTWYTELGINWCYNVPGNLMQRVCATSLNQRLCTECIKEHPFTNLNEACQIIQEWRIDYNNALTLG